MRNQLPPTQAIDECMGEEEKNRKQKEQQKKQEEGLNPATWTIWSPLTTRIDHTVGLFLPSQQPTKFERVIKINMNKTIHP